jgi:predicted O-methyltransferase YrrM
MLPDPEFLKSVKGFLDPDEGRRLYDLALESSRRAPCLEIGSYCGKSAIYLASACKINHSVLFSVDHHGGSEEQQPGEEYFDPELFDARRWRIDSLGVFRRNIERAALEDVIVPIVSHSDAAARCWATPLSLVLIDGGHAYETVETDYRVWSPHVIPSGYLLFHDIFENPRQGGQAPYQVYQTALASGAYEALPMTKTLGVLRKK